ncbi:MAG: molybdopterin-dependent oxidoreductase, partial [Pseudomonadota bacterium]
VGQAGAGVYPLLRENNAQGACDMGALPDFLPGYRKVSDPQAREVFEREWGVRVPESEGLSGIEMISKALNKEIRGMVLVGANTVETFPDSRMMQRALNTLDFLVVIDIFLTPTAKLAHVVLPAACFAEKDGTYTNCERRIQRIRKAVEPPGEGRPDWRIVADLISMMGVKAEYNSPADIMEEISRTTPIYGGVNYSRLEDKALHWPCSGPDDPGTDILYAESFPAGKGRFTKVEYLIPDDEPDIRYPFYLIARSHLYHFGSGARTKRSRLLTDISHPPSVEISPEDAEKLGVENGQNIRLTSKTGSVILKARITDGILPGMLFYPVSVSASKINSLFSAELDMLTRTPNKKMCVVNIDRV